MKIAFVNLPHRDAVVRRYMCTFHTPMFFLPPYELIQLATCMREWHGAAVEVHDAIAHSSSLAETLQALERFVPDMLVTLLGLETINADMDTLRAVRLARPGIRLIAFGHYATVFHRELLEQGVLDAVLLNEPEEPLSAYLQHLTGDKAMAAPSIPGLAVRVEGTTTVTHEQRTTDLDRFPLPDFCLIRAGLYHEMLLPGPCGVIQSSRGCPFPCTFCVTSHGRRIVYKSVVRVLDEMAGLVKVGMRHIRFVDDTFTVNRKRVLELCTGACERNIGVTWSCLARLDTLDLELLGAMKAAGCTRIFVGVESYSQPVLDSLGKDLDPARTNDIIRMIKKAGLEAVGFVMVGAPSESDEDYTRTRTGLLASGLDLVIISMVTPYPGTPLFNRSRDVIDFSLVPYRSRFKDPAIHERALAREQDLYRAFYLRPSQIWRVGKIALRFPLRSARLALSLLRFMFMPKRAKDRQDFI